MELEGKDMIHTSSDASFLPHLSDFFFSHSALSSPLQLQANESKLTQDILSATWAGTCGPTVSSTVRVIHNKSTRVAYMQSIHTHCMYTRLLSCSDRHIVSTPVYLVHTETHILKHTQFTQWRNGREHYLSWLWLSGVYYPVITWNHHL